MVITFAGALKQALLCVFEHRTLTTRCCCGTLNTSSRSSVTALSRVVSTSATIFSSIIDGYKNKQKPKTGPRSSPHLNYDVNIGLKPSPRDVKKSEPDFKLNIKKIQLCAKSVL